MEFGIGVGFGIGFGFGIGLAFGSGFDFGDQCLRARIRRAGCAVTPSAVRALFARTVDFDFGPSDSTNGFDAWRLWLYAEEQAERFSRLQTEDAIRRALDGLVRAGLVHAPQWEPSRHLLYLTKAGEVAVERQIA